MTKKEMVNEVLATVKATVKEGIYEMTANEFCKIDAAIGNGDYPALKICKNKKDDTLLSIYDAAGKTRFVVIKIVEEKKRTKKAKKESMADGSTKGNYRFYLILMKEKGSNEVKKVENINTCADIKVFLKSINKKNLEFLKIYSDGREVRKSAWIRREVA